MSTERSPRLGLAWVRARDSLWLVPSVAVIVATALAMLAVQIPTPEPQRRLARVWLFGGGAEGARGMLSAIAGSLITVTGVIFSVTIVALQLASSQFTPRVLGSFVADRVNQTVLGVFIGTFTYTLLVLRTIRSEADERSALVPHVAVTVALLLLLVSIGALIVFINHAARSIQASVILQRETERTLARIRVLFPEQIGEPDGGSPEHGARTLPPAGAPASVVARSSGYVQAVDAESLWGLGRAARREPVTVRMELDIGAFAFPGARLATVWPADVVDAPFSRAVQDAFILGPERTLEQDVEFRLVVIADIALRALSPGINDPATAVQCVDRLTEVLAALGTRGAPSTDRRSPDGAVRLLMRWTSFARALPVAFDQIRHFGAANPAIARRLLEALGALATVVPAELHEPLRHQAGVIAAQARRSIADPAEQEAISRRAARMPGSPQAEAT
jgi:uncharacterized membrane protein